MVDMHGMDELRKIDLNLLLTLHALLTEKHVTRAATRLHRSQPAVSHALAQLRDLFDDPLLIRQRGKMLLTARAQSLLAPLDAALSGLNRLVGAPAFDPATTRRRFRIAMSDYAARLVLPPLIQMLRQEAPGIDLAISQSSREAMLTQLQDGELDLALGVFPDAAPPIQKQTLFTEQFVCLADKQFLPASQTLTLEAWLAKPHVSLVVVPDTVDEIEKALIERGLRRHISLALPHWSAALHVLPGTDLLLTVASKSVTGEDYQDKLCCFAPPLPLSGFDYAQAWHERKAQDPAHQWLRRTMMLCCDNYRN